MSNSTPQRRLLFQKQNLPVLTTAVVFIVLYASFSLAFDNFFSLRVFTNLFINYAYVGVIAVGMTFVILSGGIDLSVGSVLAFTTILIASLVGNHNVHPIAAIAIALAIGSCFGAAMGSLIHFYQLPPFLVTLAGMFFARGMAFVVGDESIGISHAFYSAVTDFGIPLGPRGVALKATSLIFLVVFAIAFAVSRGTRFGRNVYAIGGSESSARLMGLPVAATKIGVYALSGFCAALGGVVLTFHKLSGNPLDGWGLELSAIAAVVIGGTLLTGRDGGLTGTLIGLLIYGTIYTGIDFHGGLSSSAQRIAIGLLLLTFIVFQRILAKQK